MKRTSLADPQCPVARTLDQVGDWWSLLVLRDAFTGLTRFAEFRESLGVATNMLARRLDKLVDDGLLERRVYAERPVRHEYLLTDKGRDLFPVIAAMLAWGNRWLALEGTAVTLADAHRRGARPRDGGPRHGRADHGGDYRARRRACSGSGQGGAGEPGVSVLVAAAAADFLLAAPAAETLVIAAVFAGFGLVTLSITGAGVRIPFAPILLGVISAVFLARGLAVLPQALGRRVFTAGEPIEGRDLACSLTALVVDALHAIGHYLA